MLGECLNTRYPLLNKNKIFQNYVEKKIIKLPQRAQKRQEQNKQKHNQK